METKIKPTQTKKLVMQIYVGKIKHSEEPGSFYQLKRELVNQVRKRKSYRLDFLHVRGIPNERLKKLTDGFQGWK